MNVEAWLNDTANRAAYSGGNDEYGDAQYSAAATLACRWEPRQQIVRDAKGIERLSIGTLFTATAVGDQDRLWIPGASTSDASLARKPIRVDTVKEKDGTVSHYEVVL